MAIQSLSDLRKSRGSFDSLTKNIEKITSKGGDKKEDETVWSCQTDAAGTGQAVIRFLTAPQGETAPFVQLWTHGFKGPTGKWYIENSRTTLGEKDPVTEFNNVLWDTGIEANKVIVRKQKRKLGYWSNVLVISDPANPENEGKVFKWRYGAKVFAMLMAKITPPEPEFDDDEKEEPSNPFDFWEGMNFKLKIVRKDDFANFDKSTFAKPSVIAETDEEIQAIWDKCYSLKDIVSADKFKPYDVLEKKLNFVLALGETPKKADQVELDEDDEAFIQKVETKAKEKIESKPKAEKKISAVVADEEENDLDYFTKLAED